MKEGDALSAGFSAGVNFNKRLRHVVRRICQILYPRTTGRQINDLNPVENIWSIINERYKDPAPKAMANWEGAYALPRKRWLLKRVISMPSHLEFV